MSQASYRIWADGRPELPLFQQPRWLDLLSRAWDAYLVGDAGDDPARARLAWPYVAELRAGLRVARWPACTPYLGPVATGRELERLRVPPGLDYVSFTFADPSLAWSLGRRARAMGTQTVALAQPARYHTNVRRNLRGAARALAVREIARDEVAAAIVQAAHWDVPLPAEAARIAPRAVGEGMARAFAVERAGRGEGLLVFAHDRSRAYHLLTSRHPGAHPATTTALVHEALGAARESGLEVYDFCAGYLSGVREFFARFGAEPAWYGSARLARAGLPRMAEWARGTFSRKRI